MLTNNKGGGDTSVQKIIGVQRTIYTKIVSQEAEQTDDCFGQMYLIGKYKEDIVYYDNTDQNTDLVVIQEDDAK